MSASIRQDLAPTSPKPVDDPTRSASTDQLKPFSRAFSTLTCFMGSTLPLVFGFNVTLPISPFSNHICISLQVVLLRPMMLFLFFGK